jgi:hypothetical protein
LHFFFENPSPGLVQLESPVEHPKALSFVSIFSLYDIRASLVHPGAAILAGAFPFLAVPFLVIGDVPASFESIFGRFLRDDGDSECSVLSSFVLDGVVGTLRFLVPAGIDWSVGETERLFFELEDPDESLAVERVTLDDMSVRC